MNTQQQDMRMKMLSQNNDPTVNPEQSQNTLGQQQQNMNTQRSQNAQVQTLNVAPAPNQTPATQLIKKRHIIWHGILEWIEKVKSDQPKQTRYVLCQVSANSKDGKPELNAASWPQKLIMQFVPKQLIGNIEGQYLKDSKYVLFHPQNCEALESLTKVMSLGYAGCVHFTSTVPRCNIKVLILLYTSEKKAYLGFIPNNQAEFVNRLREVILKQKRSQITLRGQYIGASQQQPQGQNSALLSQLSTPSYPMGVPVAPGLYNIPFNNRQQINMKTQQQAIRIQIPSQNNVPSINPRQLQNILGPEQRDMYAHNEQVQRLDQTSNVAPVPNQVPANQPIMKRRIIWRGSLEWIEKPKSNHLNQTKHIPSLVSTILKDGEPELNTASWPHKLIMQLMPKQTFANIEGQYLKDSKYVSFHPQNCESLVSFTKFLSLGHAGCVHFLSTGPLCDIRVLILIYSSEKKTYLGFIPNNQAAFVEHLKEVIHKLKESVILKQKRSQVTLRGQYLGEPQQQAQGQNSALLSQLSTSQNIMGTEQQNRNTRQYQNTQIQQQPSASNQAPPNRPIRERHIIWHGTLDFIEKGKSDQPKQIRPIPCQISSISNDGEPELNAASWPQKLVMQLMPKQIMGFIGGQYLRDSKSVLFHPLNCEALHSLTKVLSLGYAGCVHFAPTVALCDIKVLILLYTPEKKAYLGFIPNNQAAFVDRLRTVMQQQKQSLVILRGQAANAPEETGNIAPETSGVN